MSTARPGFDLPPKGLNLRFVLEPETLRAELLVLCLVEALLGVVVPRSEARGLSFLLGVYAVDGRVIESVVVDMTM